MSHKMYKLAFQIIFTNIQRKGIGIYWSALSLKSLFNEVLVCTFYPRISRQLKLSHVLEVLRSFTPSSVSQKRQRILFLFPEELIGLNMKRVSRTNG